MAEHDDLAPQDIQSVLAGAERRGWKRYIWWILLAVLLLAFFLWRSQRRAESQLPQYTTETVELGDLSAVVSATGTLEPTHRVEVGSELSGLVKEVLVDDNDQVEKGQVLAILDLSKFRDQAEKSRATLLSARAQVAQAQATLEQSRADLARLEEVSRLSGGKVPSKTELDSGRAAFARAEASLASAEASVAEAQSVLRSNETDLVKATIRSPIDGIVLDRAIEPGQTVAASFQAPVLFTLAEDLSSMQLEVGVAEADVGQVSAGQKATFTVDAWPDRVYEAQVLKVRFGSQVVENVVTYETELEVDNGDLSLRPGMTATAEVQVAERHGVLLVPNAALRFTPPATAAEGSRGFSLLPRRPRFGGQANSGAGKRIFLLVDGAPKAIAVEVGLTDGRHTEVRGTGANAAELVAGAKVILEVNGSDS